MNNDTPEFALGDVDELIASLEAQFADGKALQMGLAPQDTGSCPCTDGCTTATCPCDDGPV
jgi:hypothetical protein